MMSTTSGGTSEDEGSTTSGSIATTSSSGSTTTSGSSSSEDDSSSSESSSSESGSSSSSESSSSSGDDVDLVCEGPEGDDECESPSPFFGEGECDPFAQDCPAGDKCMPWADDGGNVWNATRCTPLAAVPTQLGDECVVEGSGVSGVDDCDLGLMCWGVDPETNQGTCIELCGCGPDAPTCSGGGTLCSVGNDGVLPICLPTCDPLDPSLCADSEGCYPLDGNFLCAPDASGRQGGPGDPCQYVNACDPGLMCAAPDLVPGCLSNGCCAEFCDIEEPDDCSLAGTDCVAFFEPGDEPEPCHTDTGVCLIP